MQALLPRQQKYGQGRLHGLSKYLVIQMETKVFSTGDIVINSHSILVGAGGRWENDGSLRSNTAVYIFRPDSAGQFHQTDKIVSNIRQDLATGLKLTDKIYKDATLLPGVR